MDDNFNTQVIGRYPIKTQLEGPGLSEAIALVQDAIAGTNYALWDHLAGIMSNDDEQVDQYCTEFITCPESNLAAAIAFNQTLPVPNQMSLEQCIALSQTITPEAVATEAITVVPQIGKSGDEIYFQKPGAYRGVAQINLARLAAIRDPRNVYQYGVLGLPYAVTAVRAAVGNGEGYVATYEIDKLWANFNPTDLSSLLHVEPAWVEAALSPRRSEVVISSESSNRPVPKMRESHLQKAKLGMFRGFPDSPISILTNLCLSKLQWRLSPHRHSVNYDNQFLIAADSDSHLEEGAAELRADLAKLPCGPFQLRETHRCRAREGFEFVGHHFFLDGRRFPVISKAALEEDVANFSDLTEHARRRDAPTKSALANLAALVAFRIGWASTYKQYLYRDDHFDAFDNQIDDLCEKFGCPLKQVEAHIEPWMGYFPNAQILGD